MRLAGEAGTLLKIEEEIKAAIDDAKSQKDENILEVQGGLFGDNKWEVREGKRYYNFGDVSDDFWGQAADLILAELEQYSETASDQGGGQKRLFSADAARGFAFINLCRKRFDVVLMNPPFGEASSNSKKYIDEAYFKTKGDVLSNFIERAIGITGPSGLIGAITSRTCLFLSTMSGLRESVLGVDAEINLCADLGDGVLDAMVETAAYTISKSNYNSDFYRLVVEKDKESKLLEACSGQFIQNVSFIVDPRSFRKLDGSPYCYWTDSSVVEKISLSGIDPLASVVKVGLQTGDDFRFLRNYWEVPSNSSEWKFFSKTEEAISWHSPIKMKVIWLNDGYEIKNFENENGKLRSRPQNLDAYFKPGFSYMLRSSRLVPYIVPKGCIPTAGRSQVFPDKGKEVDVLAICASNLGSAVARFRGEMFGRPKFQASMIQQLPFVELSDEVKSSVQFTMLNAIKSAKDYYSIDETTLDYIGCPGLIIKSQPKANFKTFLGEDNEIALAKCYGLTEEEYQELQLDLQQAVSLRKYQNDIEEAKLQTQAAKKYLSWLIGRAFGRWQKTAQPLQYEDIYAELPEQSPAFNWSDPKGNIEASGVADVDSSGGLIETIIALANTEVAEQCLLLVGAGDWKTYLEKPSQFFATHYDQYSQNKRYSPIYWPLQSSSGSYTLWIYFQRLNEQTLYTSINDFVEPKLENIATDINSLVNKPDRSSHEEQNLARLNDFESELKDFRDELLQLAKFWKPNLNDGVQITAAPLWRFFKHKPWQKKLKKTWEKLESGEYDWAHLAYNIWPERVLKKCHQDRSIAIAHGVETDLWQEVELVIGSSKKIKSTWQAKEMTEAELDTYIKNKITQG